MAPGRTHFVGYFAGCRLYRRRDVPGTMYLVGRAKRRPPEPCKITKRIIERVRQGLPDGLEDLHTFVACITERYSCRQFGLRGYEDRVYRLFLLVLEAVHDGGLHDPGTLKRFVRTAARYAWKC